MLTILIVASVESHQMMMFLLFRKDFSCDSVLPGEWTSLRPMGYSSSNIFFTVKSNRYGHWKSCQNYLYFRNCLIVYFSKWRATQHDLASKSINIRCSHISVSFLKKTKKILHIIPPNPITMKLTFHTIGWFFTQRQ